MFLFFTTILLNIFTGESELNSDSDIASSGDEDEDKEADTITLENEEEDDNSSIVSQISNHNMSVSMKSLGLSAKKKVAKKLQVQKKLSEDVHVMKAPFLFSTRTTFLYVQFKYTENKKHFICVEFLVFMLSSRHYRPEMLASDILGLSIVVPRPFYLENRHTDVTVHGSENKSKAVSYR